MIPTQKMIVLLLNLTEKKWWRCWYCGTTSKETVYVCKQKCNFSSKNKELNIGVCHWRYVATVKSPATIKLISVVSSAQVSLPYRKSFTAHLHKVFDMMEQRVKSTLDKVDFVCTTADVWTAHNGALLPTSQTVIKMTRYMKPNLSITTTGLAYSIEDAITHHFESIFDFKEAILAAITLSKFKLRWVETQTKKDQYKQMLILMRCAASSKRPNICWKWGWCSAKKSRARWNKPDKGSFLWLSTRQWNYLHRYSGSRSCQLRKYCQGAELSSQVSNHKVTVSEV